MIWTLLVDPSTTPTGYGIAQVGERLDAFMGCCADARGLVQVSRATVKCSRCSTVFFRPVQAFDRPVCTNAVFFDAPDVANWIGQWTGLTDITVDVKVFS